ncbi:amino acid adenylation domain-containing protein [Actinoplanes sp. NPDC023936]|uniref:non-ribosomal peptide synthetase n=1 Tax=Actinoplanes sp. NPDC023936 TaxID=3154910 RepID=UPI003410ECDB
MTVDGLSAAKQRLLASWARGQRSGRVEIPRRGDDGPAPLSFSQQRLWFLERMVPDSPAYNTPMAVELRGPLDTGALRFAVQRIVDRHEALRTVIAESDGEPVQIVRPPAPVDLPVTDLTGLPEAGHDRRVRDLLQEEAARIFDLPVGPLVRFGLLRLSAERHVFLVNWSHLIADGWSGRIFSRELAECYAAYVAGRPPRLPELKLQYADFAVWQRDRLRGPELERQVRYWRDRLAGIPAVLELPSDRPRPVVQSFRGDTLRFTVDAELTARVRQLCADTDATLFTVLLSAYAVVLSRWSGRPDVVIGTPVANRGRPELEDVFGFFANTLALRTTLDGDPSFRDLVSRAGPAVIADFAHQDLPFEKLVEELQPERSTSHNPIFQVMLALNNTPPPTVELTPDTHLAGLIEGDTGAAKFDLWLSLADAGQTLPGGLEFATDLFDTGTAERFLTGFRRVLEQVVADPDLPISRLDLMDAGQRDLVLRQWNDTAAAEPEPRLIHELIRQQAAATPDAIAVEFEDRTLTYAELDGWANRLAHRLRRHGIGPESRVAIFLDRSPELMVALLGTLKAGGCYVPLDAEHPPARLAYLLDDCGADVVLTAAGGTPPGARTVIDLGADRCDDEPGDPPVTRVSPDHPAYVIYTSGSTGRPKGVVNGHRGVVNRLRWMQRRFRLAPGEKVLQKTPAGFDVSVWEFFWPLLCGGAVTLARPDGHRDPGYLAGLINRSGVSIVHFVPSMLRLFLDEPSAATCTGLRQVVCSGEALSRDLAARFHRTLPAARLDNLYGPTEAAVDVTAHECLPGETGDVPIGTPVDNTRIYVLDRAGHPAPIGVPGELCIGGVQVARGYAGRPGMTADRFVPDPFAGRPGARMYRTGDIVRWRPGGVLAYLGREDLQVKLGGIRFELAEIEAALREHPAVADVLVTVGREEGGQVTAYVVPRLPATEQPVEQWGEVFDDAYQAPAGPAELNFSSWNSSYTGAPIPAEQMREWADRTSDLVLAEPPGRVLEVGCGLGLLLLRIGPHATAYHGTDVSAFAVAQLSAEVKSCGLANVTVEQRPAHRLGDLPAASFDTVLLNSVVQYFPDAGYLRDVLAQARRLLAPGGRIVVGDVRSLPLLGDFHLTVELDRAAPEEPAAVVRGRAATRTWQEEELALDPAFFTGLPDITDVEIRLKRGGYDNELSRFRYDVILRPEGRPEEVPLEMVPWREGIPLRHDIILTGIPNARLSQVRAVRRPEAATAATVAELRALTGAEPSGVDPEHLHDLAGAAGMTAVLTPDPADPTRFDAILSRSGVSRGRTHRAGQGRLANWPRQARLMAELGPAWRKHLRERIPEYAVPAAFVPVPAIPLSANGKADWSALPAPPPAAARDTGEYVPPAPGTERLLAEVWASVLGLERVSATANYFELGGDSIRGIRVMARANREGLALQPRDLFAHPTVRELAEVADGRAGSAPAEDEHTGWGLSGSDEKRRAELLADPDVEDAFPLAPYQAYMLGRLTGGEPRPGEYLVQRIDTLCGPIDVPLLRRCWAGLARRYAMLRTAFVTDGLDEPLQVVHRDVELPSRYEDWRSLSTPERDDRLAEFLREDQRIGCTPDDPAGIRLFLARVGDEAYRTVFSFSYLRMEGWSLSVFLSDVIGEYHRIRAGEPVAEGPPEVPFSRYVGWLRRRGVPADTAAFWQRMFRGGTGPTLLAASAPGNRPGTQTGYARRHLQVDAALSDGLKVTGQHLRMPPNTLVQAAWALLLARYANRDEATIGVFLNGRPADLPGVEDLTGPTMNVLPLRIRLPEPDRPVSELLRLVMTAGADAAHHQHVAPGQIAHWAGRPERTPMFDAYLVFQNLDPLLFGSTERVPTFFTRMAEPFRLDVMPGVELGLILSYHRDLLTDDAAATVLGDMVATLAAIIADPDRPIAEALRPPPVPTGEKALLIEGELRSGQIKDTPFPGADR